MPRLLQQGTRVAWIGDSHSEALGPRMASMLPEATGIQFVRPPEARRGWSTRRYAQSGDVPALVRGADVVIVELGGNDAAAHIDAARHANDVHRLLQQIAPRKVIWIGPGITMREDLERYRGPIRDVQKQVVEGAGGVWIDAQPLTRASELAPDQMHYLLRGYDAWAQRLIPVLQRAGVGNGAGAGPSVPVWVGPVIFGSAGLLLLGAWLWSLR